MKTKQRSRMTGFPDQRGLADVIEPHCRGCATRKNIRFGSAARGEMGPNSDIDLLIIRSGKFNRDRVTRDIYRCLTGAAAVDAVVVTSEEVERYGDSPCLVIYPALREGRVVYRT